MISAKVFYIWPKTKTIENLFPYFDTYASLLPIIVFFLSWKKSSSAKDLWLIIAYSASFFLINVFLKNYDFIYELFTVMEFILFVGLLHFHIKREEARKAIIITSICFTLFYFSFTFLASKETSFDSIQTGVETIIILVFAYYYLYERMNDTSTLFIYNTYPFWIIIAIVLYLSGNFFVYISTSSMTDDDIRKYWTITNIFSIVKSILFSIAILMHSKPPNNNLPSDLELSRLN